MSDSRPIAHVRFDENGEPIEHWLDDHLRDVAKLAAEFAADFGADWARVAGIWHDLGKYNPAFQKYICDKTGYKRADRENAHVETQPGKVDHSTAGAIHAVETLGDIGRILAYLIAGHHAGLPDWYRDDAKGRALVDRIADKTHLQKALHKNVPETIHSPNIALIPPSFVCGEPDHFALWVRILFSALVDADFLDTEKFMNEDRFLKRGQYQPLSFLRQRFNIQMDKLLTKANQNPTQVNQIRAAILRQCREAACEPVGLFSLSVPTGGGKTLSSMAFALDHAITHHLQRIIYVIPYTSIIEQTAQIFRDIFGTENVLEHHSNTDPDLTILEDSASRLAAENWDAPIIVTTSVQYFESLFAARTSRCRKLHNIVNSVVVLDETQLLPPEHLDPILRVMRQLSRYYRVTQILSTATQPALQKERREPVTDALRCAGLGDVTEMVAETETLYQQLERVRIRLPKDFSTPTEWPTLANTLRQLDRVLVVVNTRKDARELHALMPKGTYHLSALMCAEHRSQVIEEIKHRLLDNRESVRVVSTQLVEAGVDMDFPVVYRAMAGLDSIAQAAGRCNREGRLDGKGEVVVFVPPKPSIGLLGKAADSCIHVLAGYAGQVLESVPPSWFTRFFDRFYGKVNTLDKAGIVDLLMPEADLTDCQFRTAALHFRMIEDDDSQAVFVRFDETSERLLDEVKRFGPERYRMRKLQRYTVTLPKREFDALVKVGDISPIWDGIYAQKSSSLYNPILGLQLSGEALTVESLFW